MPEAAMTMWKSRILSSAMLCSRVSVKRTWRERSALMSRSPSSSSAWWLAKTSVARAASGLSTWIGIAGSAP